MEKMNKITVAVRIKPDTKVMLEVLRNQLGLPMGAVIDKVIEDYGKMVANKKYTDKPFEDGQK